MTNRFTTRLAAFAALAFAFVLHGTRARADVELEFSTNNGATWSQATLISNSNEGFSFQNSVGVFNVNFSVVLSNSPGTPTLAINTTEDDSIQNTSNHAATLEIAVSASGFNSPESPPPLGLSGTSSVTPQPAGTNALANNGSTSGIQVYADQSNNLFQQGSSLGMGTTGPSASFVQDPVSLTYGATAFAPNSFAPNGNTYSLTLVTTLDVSANSAVGLTGNVSAITPEPTTMGSAVLGLGLFGGLGWLRRRNRRA